MNAFCNYLRGVNDAKQDQAGLGTTPIDHKLRTFKRFLKHFTSLFKYFFPRFMSVSTFFFVILLINVVVLEFVIYQVGSLSGKFYKTLSSKDLDGFVRTAVIAVGWIVLNSLLLSTKGYLAQLLSIIWRQHITLNLHELYFANRNFYYLLDENGMSDKNGSSESTCIEILNQNVNDSVNPLINNQISSNLISRKKITLDNPDQRITQDVNSLCVSLSIIIPIVLISPFVIGWYTYQAFITVGYFGPLAAFVYFILCSFINGPFMSPLAKVIYDLDKREGDFRYKHMNIRVNAETIAFYNSSKNEHEQMNKSLTGVLSENDIFEKLFDYASI
jgi:ATP-binding cassette, subfamily D (ALD), member 4